MKLFHFNQIVKILKKRGARGSVSIEYGLAASLIAVAAISSLSSTGNSISSTLDKVSTAMLGINNEPDRPMPMGSPPTEAPPNSAAPTPLPAPR